MDKEKKQRILITTIVAVVAILIVCGICALSIKPSDNAQEEVATDQVDDNTTENGATEDNEIDYSKYDATKIIGANSDNGNIGDHVRGKSDSKVVVVEYADMSCPGCAIMMSYMTNLYKAYGNRVAFVFRHYPLSSHENSEPAAAAVESASRQGKYWDMLEALFDKRSEWLSLSGEELTNKFVEIFKNVAPKGDEAKFRSALNYKNIVKKIDFDYYLGKKRSGVHATPSIFVNGELIDMSGDGVTFDMIVSNIQDKIEEKLK